MGQVSHSCTHRHTRTAAVYSLIPVAGIYTDKMYWSVAARPSSISFSCSILVCCWWVWLLALQNTNNYSCTWLLLILGSQLGQRLFWTTWFMSGRWTLPRAAAGAAWSSLDGGKPEFALRFMTVFPGLVNVTDGKGAGISCIHSCSSSGSLYPREDCLPCRHTSDFLLLF